MGVTAPKVSKGRSQTSFLFMPFGRLRRGETLCTNHPKVRKNIHLQNPTSAMSFRADTKPDPHAAFPNMARDPQ